MQFSRKKVKQSKVKNDEWPPHQEPHVEIITEFDDEDDVIGKKRSIKITLSVCETFQTYRVRIYLFHSDSRNRERHAHYRSGKIKMNASGRRHRAQSKNRKRIRHLGKLKYGAGKIEKNIKSLLSS